MSKKPTLSLSLAKKSDSDFAFMVKKAAFREYVDEVSSWDEAEQRKLHEARYASQEFRILSFDGSRVGVTARAMKHDCIKLNQLYILPEHQSKNIGESCMMIILQEAKQHALPVRLQALKVNSGAQRFYDRLGFKKTGETDTHVEMEWHS